jgi:hypothetical protein
MKVTIDKVSAGAEGIWTAKIHPQRLIKLGDPILQGHSRNIVLVEQVGYDEHTNTLQFDLESAIIINVGNGFETLFVESRKGQQ